MMPVGTIASDSERRSAGITRRGITINVLRCFLSAGGLWGLPRRPGTIRAGTRWGGAFQSNPIEITILSVTPGKGDQPEVEAGRNEVPFRIAWETGPWGDRVLLELKATLNIADDSGTAVEVTKEVGVKDKKDTMVVTLAEGRVPKSYRLTLVGQCRFTGDDGKIRIEPTTAELAGGF